MLADKEPSWDEVAASLAAMGLRDGDGKPPTGERVRKAWWALRRARAALAERQDAFAPVLPRGEIAPGVPWTRVADGPDIAVALKSGNFGGPDFFIRAMGMLAVERAA